VVVLVAGQRDDREPRSERARLLVQLHEVAPAHLHELLVGGEGGRHGEVAVLTALDAPVLGTLGPRPAQPGTQPLAQIRHSDGEPQAYLDDSEDREGPRLGPALSLELASIDQIVLEVRHVEGDDDQIRGIPGAQVPELAYLQERAGARPGEVRHPDPRNEPFHEKRKRVELVRQHVSVRERVSEEDDVVVVGRDGSLFAQRDSVQSPAVPTVTHPVVDIEVVERRHHQPHQGLLEELDCAQGKER